MFAGNFAPRAWAFCQGQIMSIAQNTALFSLLGTTYGGNGQTTFALPDFRGRTAVGTGQGPGLPNITLGEVDGNNSVTLTTGNLPAHNHQLLGYEGDGNQTKPDGALCATANANIYAVPGATAQMNAKGIGMTGNNQPFNITNPYLGMNYIICLEGIYPSRN